MNKTININLANTFFHIDEEAYLQLQRYLETVKRSFTKSQGKDEIISDIEARIAELFTERLQHDRQVITTKEVEEIISIMGQPEDYLVDEELFEDEPKRTSENRSKTHKQLFRDIDRKYIGGVCAGLSHYVGLDVLWIRLLFILIAIISFGTGILLYLILWILVPDAVTTAQKIAMAGDPVNISNIEKKIKESFDDVTEKVKNVNYDKMGASVKKNSKNFIDSSTSVFMVLLKTLAKFIGIVILITAATALVSLLYALITAGTMDLWGAPWNDYIHATIDAPIWAISLLGLLSIGIPLFFLFYLGLKILVNNLKSIGNFAKFTLLGLWMLSIIGITVLGIKTASSYAFHATATQVEHPEFNPGDTLTVKIASTDALRNSILDSDDFIISDLGRTDGQKSIYSEDVDFRIRASENDKLRIEIEKESQGESQRKAHNRAEMISYAYRLEAGVLTLDNYLSTALENGFRDQEVTVTLFLPSSAIIKLHPSTRHHLEPDNNKGFESREMTKNLWRMDTRGTLICVDCFQVNNWKNTNRNNVNKPADTLGIHQKQDSI